MYRRVGGTLARARSPAARLRGKQSSLSGGVYEIGLSDMWVYDFFRMVRIRLDNRFVTRLFVMPRRFELPPQSGFSDSENVTDTS